MQTDTASAELLDLLNQAVARELQVSVQYMLQHALEAGREPAASGKTKAAARARFVASHALYFLPGPTLKKIAITEMRHAEAISEWVVRLGGEPPTQPAHITTGKTPQEMLENDREQERQAIQLYRHIIDVAQQQADKGTMSLFQRILADEEKHHRIFSDLLKEG